MDEIDEQLNSLKMVEVPMGMHHAVMHKVYRDRLIPVFFIALVLLVFNFIVAAWHINMRLVNAEFLDMVKDFFEVFSFNSDFVSVIFKSFFEIISPELALSAALSLAGIIYIGKKMAFFRIV